METTKTWGQGPKDRKSCACIIPKHTLLEFEYATGDELYIDWSLILAMSRAHELKEKLK